MRWHMIIRILKRRLANLGILKRRALNFRFMRISGRTFEVSYNSSVHLSNQTNFTQAFPAYYQSSVQLTPHISSAFSSSAFSSIKAEANYDARLNVITASLESETNIVPSSSHVLGLELFRNLTATSDYTVTILS